MVEAEVVSTMNAEVAEKVVEAVAIAEVEVIDEVQIRTTMLMKSGINSHMSRECFFFEARGTKRMVNSVPMHDDESRAISAVTKPARTAMSNDYKGASSSK